MADRHVMDAVAGTVEAAVASAVASAAGRADRHVMNAAVGRGWGCDASSVEATVAQVCMVAGMVQDEVPKGVQK